MGTATLRVNGRSYRLGCADGEEDRLIDLARHVDECVEKVRTEFGQVGDDRLLVLTALLLTDELFETREKLVELSDLVKQRLGRRAKPARRHDDVLDAAIDAIALNEAEINRRSDETESVDEDNLVADQHSGAQARLPGKSSSRNRTDDEYEVA